METVIRITFIYLFLMVALRIMGKREFGQLAPFDLLVLLLIPELFQQSMVREDFSLTNALIGVCTLLSLVFMTSVLAYRSRVAGEVIEGQPVVLVQDGELRPESLDRERVTPSEVLDAVHRVGLERMEQVRWAILSTAGEIHVVPRNPAESRPVKQEGAV